MTRYQDNEGKSHEVSEECLARAVLYKIEIQKDQGKANWKKIVKMLKADGFKDVVQSEGFRQAVKNYQRKTGKLPRREDFEQSSLTLRLGELSQAKRELQNERREFNKLKRELLDESLFRKELEKGMREAINNFEANWYIHQQNGFNDSEGLKVVKNKQNSDDNNDALVVSLSDWHIGCKFKTNYNEFNFDIVTSLVTEYLNKIEELIDGLGIKNVLLLNLGDTIEHVYMRNFSQSFEAEFDFSTQQAKAIELVSRFIKQLCLDYPQIQFAYSAVSGNHDRMNSNKKEVIYGDSFQTILNLFLKNLPLKNFEVIEQDSPVKGSINFNGVNIAFEHGDKLNLNNRNILATVSQRDGKIYDALLVGHLHHYQVIENNGLFVMSGSLKGKDTYSESLNLKADRSQACLLIRNKKITPLMIRLGDNC
ncbi:DNA polymerase [Lactobacillus phage Ldl1]|uniref:DNA polymerase n=1 Tax=Lactobacillus phage Ldl1 TaxID=1552735 RepID=A0A0A7DN05_9CAUD|nr:DNA polymerase [Lactobacillus phage Ldl1]AIS73924.1 DNA polymerase [Lactobacillus phage Ldl1]